MCTSLTLPLADGTQLFGRTLDWHEHFDEGIVRVPSAFSFDFGRRSHTPRPKLPALPDARSRYALCGMATVIDGYPLFADAMNERGLCMAGLRFSKGAFYLPPPAKTPHGVLPLAPWELIPYVLGSCATVAEAKEALSDVRILDLPFSRSDGCIPTSPLHWHIAGKDAVDGSVVVEATAAGLQIYDDPLGVLANDPAFPSQCAAYEVRRAAKRLPGAGFSSEDRFCRAAYLREMTAPANASVERFFEITRAVSPPAGTVPAAAGDGWQTTLYTCCMDGAKGLYHQITPDRSEARICTFSDAPELTDAGYD